MPYKLDCNDDGCFVVNTETGKRKNKKRMPKSRANKYMKALYHAEKEFTMKDFIEFLFNDQEEIASKEMSLDERVDLIRDQIRRKLNPPETDRGAMVDVPEPYYWIRYIYEDYAIAEKDGEHIRINYSLDEEGNVVIGGVQKVEMAWVLSGKEHGELLYSFEDDPKSDHLMVFKEASGDYRWIMFSSNAFQDRDGEIVSLKALTDDVARADKDGIYGPLRWWHIGEPDTATKSAGPGLDIGDCDFNDMHGKILLESGTFRDQEIGKIIAEKSSELQGSILFFHPQSEPDDEGVFHNIHRAERSLLPKGKASNSLVSLLVTTKELEMDILTEKWNQFVKLVGGESKVKEALKTAELTEKEAEALGQTWKGDDPDPDGEPAGEKPAGEKPEGEKPEGEKPEGEEPESDVVHSLGALTPDQFQEMQEKGLKGLFDPLGVQLKEIQSAQSLANDTQTSMKEVMEGQAKQLKAIDERVKELEGETPRSREGYRPSQDGDTVLDEDHALKSVKPGIDKEFMEFVIPGNANE